MLGLRMNRLSGHKALLALSARRDKGQNVCTALVWPVQTSLEGAGRTNLERHAPLSAS